MIKIDKSILQRSFFYTFSVYWLLVYLLDYISVQNLTEVDVKLRRDREKEDIRMWMPINSPKWSTTITLYFINISLLLFIGLIWIFLQIKMEHNLFQ